MSVHSALRSAWNEAKRSHTIRLGPVAVIGRISATAPVSRNAPGRLRRAMSRWLGAPVTVPFPRTALVGARAPSSRRPLDDQVAVLVGVGPGVGQALAHALAAEGMRVAMLARRAHRLDPLVAELAATSRGAAAYGCDATDERSVAEVMSLVRTDLGEPDLVVYCVEGFHPGRALDVEVCAFEDSWRNGCLGAFIVAREAARPMVARGRGTIVFLGASSSVVGRPGYLNLAVGTFGVRAMSQVMAKELAPAGVHVVHLIIDGGIEEEGVALDDGRTLLDPRALADIVRFVHTQPKRGWTNELDARAGDEQWWQRC
jgi:NAD(P)-dependent dehydrogenase (short-subunit alcohol dehydrogenase family)